MGFWVPLFSKDPVDINTATSGVEALYSTEFLFVFVKNGNFGVKNEEHIYPIDITSPEPESFSAPVLATRFPWYQSPSTACPKRSLIGSFKAPLSAMFSFSTVPVSLSLRKYFPALQSGLSAEHAPWLEIGKRRKDILPDSCSQYVEIPLD